jgi:ribokinase
MLCRWTYLHRSGATFRNLVRIYMKPIVVVGSINMDLVSQTKRIPQPGETVIGSGFQMHSGGKGANQAVAVARLDYPSILLGVLGDDIFGRQLLSTLNGFGVETEHIGSTRGSSGTASIVVDARGENTIIVTPGSNDQVTPDYLRTKLDVLRSAGMVLAQLEIPVETVAWLAGCCVELGVPLMLDPAPATLLPPTLLSQVAWFTPNQTEAAFYAGADQSAEQMLGRFFAMGIRNIILKQGPDGAIVASADGTRHRIDAFKVNAIDTTAAGDSFNGAFSVALMRGLSLAESAKFAAAAAALSVTRHGAQTSLPSQEEVATLLSGGAGGPPMVI